MLSQIQMIKIVFCVCGVWTGFDQKKTIGTKETGGMVSAPTWLYFMQPFLDSIDNSLLNLAVEKNKEDQKIYGIKPMKEDLKIELKHVNSSNSNSNNSSNSLHIVKEI